MDPAGNKFREAVQGILDRGGNKGYNTALRQICKNLPHALGEIVYKVVRYHVRRDPQDLVKVAAWAELEWNDVNREGSQSGSGAITTPTRSYVAGTWTGSKDSDARSAGGRTGRSGSIAPTKTFSPADVIAHGFEIRASSGGRSRSAVGRQHRQRKGKGRK